MTPYSQLQSVEPQLDRRVDAAYPETINVETFTRRVEQFSEFEPDVLMTSPTSPETRYVLEAMGDLAGKRILDLGCGIGESAVFFAKQGAKVTACDVSFKLIEGVRKLAELHHVDIEAVACKLEKLPFSNGEFDLVFAQGALFEAEVIPVMLELERVLKSGGKAYIMEPLRKDPLVSVDRATNSELRFPHKRPLTFMDQERIRAVFPQMKSRSFRLLTQFVFLYFLLVERVSPKKERYWTKLLFQASRYDKLYSTLKRWDDRLLEKMSFLNAWCFSRVIEVTRA